MAGLKNNRPRLIFRKTRGNRHTLPRLLGILEGEGLNSDFHLQFGNSVQEIVRLVGGERAVIAFSFMTPHLMDVKGEVEQIRGIFKGKVQIIAGGPHPSGDPQGTLNLGFDFVFVGEADQAFPAFLRHYLGGELPDSPILGERKGICPIGTHPPFSFEHRFFAPLEITRGCRYRCRFCQTPRIFGHQLRHRLISDFSDFLKKANPLGYRQITFITPNAFSYRAGDSQEPNLPAIEELLRGCLETGASGIHFGCYPSEVRPDWINPEILQMVRKYCRNRTLVLGAQSGSDSILSSLQRGHTAEENINAARLIFEAGFMPHADFVFGFPEETLGDRRLSISMINKMIDEYNARIHAHIFMPLPGTPLFQKNPSCLDQETKNALVGFEKGGKLDGWWKDQEVIGWKIVEWRDRGIIKSA